MAEEEGVLKLWMDNSAEDQALRKLMAENSIPKGLGPITLQPYYEQYKQCWPDMKLSQFCRAYAKIRKEEGTVKFFCTAFRRQLMIAFPSNFENPKLVAEVGAEVVAEGVEVLASHHRHLFLLQTNHR